ncbi:myb-related transcription factor, partner of profilin-like [Cyprinus carpio]|uniref:Myb-related transcription factor, partner of profilin-like n=1 Tax=Cyprinus carpio TaxID=7962 RepID=A0A9Q9XXZ2_CYPCA|nr:myb-related transcription factor, partner of profilin-like [Cyprinus carpio]
MPDATNSSSCRRKSLATRLEMPSEVPLQDATSFTEVVLYGDGRNPPKIASVKQAWEEIATIVSSAGISRTSHQCRKPYNDIRRRGKSKLASINRARRVTGGGSASTQDLTPAEDIAASTLTAESVEGFGGFEIGTQSETQAVQPQASQEDPGLASRAHGPSEEGTAQPSRSGPTTRRGSIARPEDHPFLQLQQTGFEMLERELSGMRQSVNGRLDRMAMLLRPLGRISSSLERIAAAMERGPSSAPPPPVVPLPPSPTPSPSTRSTRRTSRNAIPGPSGVRSRRGARRKNTRGGKKK